jgi:predicted lipoprotein with Yx(FWY)xxD motif
MEKHLGTGIAALFLGGLLLSGCAGSPGAGTDNTTPPVSAGSATVSAPGNASTSPTGSAAASPTVSPGADGTEDSEEAEMMVAESSVGPIVVDADGMSLYYFTKDVKDSGTSACTGDCLKAWPPLTTESEEPAVEGITGTVGTIATPDGDQQVTINGMPVYYYAKDTAAGDITGQGVGGVWYLIDPAGEMITAPAR